MTFWKLYEISYNVLDVCQNEKINLNNLNVYTYVDRIRFTMYVQWYALCITYARIL